MNEANRRGFLKTAAAGVAAASLAVLAKTKPEATDGRHELFKSTQNFDGPYHQKQHGFTLKT